MSFGLRFRLYLNFPGRIVLILGVCLAILGILDIVLAVTGFVQKIWGHYYATGIWCGVVVFIDGLCGILASQTRTNFAVKTFFVFSLISVLVSFIMIILSCGGLDFKSNFYDHVFSYHGRHGRATKAVHGSLLALALVEFVVSIINALLCLKSSCQEDKASLKCDQSKLKQSSVHRPPSYKDADQPHGFRGGNPNSVPVSERPVVRKYQSPRRSQNGAKIYREEFPMDEPTETTEFLPNRYTTVEEESYERENRRQRLGSKEHDNTTDTHHKKTPTRGRMYRRQQEQPHTESISAKRNYDNQRNIQTSKHSSTEYQPCYMQNEDELNRWKQTDNLVRNHQYYHLRHSDKTPANNITVQELKASQHAEHKTGAFKLDTVHTTIPEQNTHAPKQGTVQKTITEQNTGASKLGTVHKTITEQKTHDPKQGTVHKTITEQNTHDPKQGTVHKTITEQKTHDPKQGTVHKTITEQNTHDAKQGTVHKTITEQNTPDADFRVANRHNVERNTVPKPRTNYRPSLQRNYSVQEQLTPSKPSQDKRTQKRPGEEQTTQNRPLPRIQPQTKEHSENFDRKRVYRERRNNERSDSFRENVDGEKIKTTQRSDRAADKGQIQRLNVNESMATKAGRSNMPSGYMKTQDKDTELMKDNFKSPVVRHQPLRRSIGARGSYNAAVNLMPTEPEVKTVKEHRTAKGVDNKPPTAFGEEELPGYAEVCPNDSHIYSSIESALSRQETDRIISSDQGAYSADHSIVSHSVADEEVQEILGTQNTSTVVKRNISEIPNMNSNASMNARTVKPNSTNTTVIDLNKHPVSTDTSQFKPQREVVKGRLKQKLHLKTRELIPDQSSSETSLALPSPLSPSPTFLRSHKTGASDFATNSDLCDIPDIIMQQSFRASFPIRKLEWDRHPRRWGISPFVNTSKQLSPQVPTSLTEEGNALNELSSSFPLLGALGGVDFGISDQESYLQTPDNSLYTFNYDEVKPKVFTVSPFRTPQKSSPLNALSVAQLPSTDDEIEYRPRVIETVNVGLASPPLQRRKPNNLLPTRPGAVGQATSTHVVKPKLNIALSPEQPTSPTYFYPPERLPSRVSDNKQDKIDSKQRVLSDKTQSKGVSDKKFSQPSQEAIYSGLSPVQVQTKPDPTFGSSRPEDANVAFLAFNDALSQRTAWERQTFPPVQPLMGAVNVPNPRRTGRASMRGVMRSEQSAQEEPLHHQSATDYRFHFRIPPSNVTPEPSPPLSGGPPPYSSVARDLPPQRASDRAPLQPHSSGQSNRQNRSDTARRKPVFSLVL